MKWLDPKWSERPGAGGDSRFPAPGMGHFYQQRIFKGLVLRLHSRNLLAVRTSDTVRSSTSIGRIPKTAYAYLCQFWVRLPLCRRWPSRNFVPRRLADVNHLPNRLPAAEGVDGFQLRGRRERSRTIELKPSRADGGHWTADLNGTLTTPWCSQDSWEDHSRQTRAEVAPFWPERHCHWAFRKERGDRLKRSLGN